MAFYNEDITQIFKKLKTSKNGILSSSAKERATLYGTNELEKQKHISFFKKLLLQFKNIMIIILIISAIISSVTAITEKNAESMFEGILIFAIVLINAVVGVIQEQKAENALMALAKSTEPFANVVRDGSVQKIKAHEVVVGDIVILKSGDSIPADIRLIDSINFKCNESSITGESEPVLKTHNKISKANPNISDQENMCFSGTSAVSGKATGVVVAVGKNTELGKIAGILSTSIKEKTPLEKNIDKIGKVITFGVLGIVAVVFFVQLFLNKNAGVMQSLLTAVALAVAAIPESLPAVITIIMALGVQKLARKNAIIKKLSAVETLGCCNVICSDKTGTLTKNNMVASHIYINLKTFDAKNIHPQDIQELANCLSVCNNVSANKDGSLVGDATEIAIVKFLNSKNVSHLTIKNSFKKLHENEFNSTRKIMSVVCEKSSQKTLFAKGAIDYILPKCDTIFIDGEIKPLSIETKQKILQANESVCLEGERVIAFATKNASIEQSENNLTFVGFMGIIDPPRSETFEAVKKCKSAGLKTIMITGDHPTTAYAIAKKLAIAKSKNEVLTGNDLNNLSIKELSKIIHNYSVFARVTPEHKLMIVNALKQNGNIVSMTGDGINDAPSIKTANIGVCMGITGTDVTKEVADVIISDDNFSTIVAAISEGRTIYQNITKTIIFLLSTNIVEVLGIFVTSLIMPEAVFLSPAQILFINLITDSLPAFALGIEPAERDIMMMPPRNSHQTLLSGTTGWTILYQGFVQSLIVLVMFVLANYYFGTGIASTMSFMTICLMQIIHAVNCKTDKSLFKINIFKNKFFNFSFVVLFALILTIYFVPTLAILFSLSKLSGLQWLVIAITSISIIPIVEIGKIFTNKKR